MFTESLDAFVSQLAAVAPTPSGGAAAGVTAAMGAALIAMSLGIMARATGGTAELEALALQAGGLIDQLMADAERDVQAVRSMIRLRKSPARASALNAATESPLTLAGHAVAALELGIHAQTLVRGPVAVDLKAGIALLHGAIEAALATVAANIGGLSPADRAPAQSAYDSLRARVSDLRSAEPRA